MARNLTTTVSAEGRVTLPKAMREKHDWIAGTQLIVQDSAYGVLLKPAPLFAPSDPKDVFGSLKVRGKPKTLAQMKVSAKYRRL